MEESGSLQVKRKPRPQLTLVPEDEKAAINFRFEVAIVGEGANEFAKMAVESEMAEAFHPKGYNAAADLTATIGGATSNHSSSKLGGSEKEQLTLFCPIGDVSEKRGLARVRLICCESFSDSLPVHKEATVAMNTAIVFLFWRVDKGSGSAAGDRVSDFTSRLAELNHGAPADARPHAVVYGFDLDGDQESRLNDFLKKPLASGVQLEKFKEDNEDVVMEALTDLCEKIILAQNKRQTVAAAPRSIGEQPAKGRCCTIS